MTTLPKAKTKKADKQVNPFKGLFATLQGLMSSKALPKGLVYRPSKKSLTIGGGSADNMLFVYPRGDNDYKSTICIHANADYKPSKKYLQGDGKALGCKAIVNAVHKGLSIPVYSINDQWRAKQDIGNYHVDNKVICYDIQTIDHLKVLLKSVWDKTKSDDFCKDFVDIDALAKFVAPRLDLATSTAKSVKAKYSK